MTNAVATRETQTYTIFFRTTSGEGGYLCHRCGSSCSDTFARIGHAFAVATQHLAICRSSVRHRPIEGWAVINGKKHAAVLRDGVMVVAVEAVFERAARPLRVMG